MAKTFKSSLGNDLFANISGNIVSNFHNVVKELRRFANDTENHGTQYTRSTYPNQSVGDACIENKVYQAIYLKDANSSKSYFQNIPGVLWQYYSTSKDGCIQYPIIEKTCGEGRSEKTRIFLTEQWFVNKFMMKKNVVFLVDMGRSTSRPVGKSNVTRHAYYSAAVIEALNTFSEEDKVNVITFDNTVHVPVSCDSRLLTGNRDNIDQLKNFLEQTTHSNRSSNLSAALEKAYELIEAEMSENPTRHSHRKDIILVTDAQFNESDRNAIRSVLQKQPWMNGLLYHMVYTLGSPNSTHMTEADARLLASIVHNGTIRDYRKILGLTFTDVNTSIEKFALIVSNYYTYNNDDQMESDFESIAPIVDSDAGLTMIISLPQKEPSGEVKVAAVEVSLASFFAAIQDFSFGVHSYAFLVKRINGQVLLHPKLKDPSLLTGKKGEIIFPLVEVLEPELANIVERLKNVTVIGEQEELQLQPGRTTFLTSTEEPLPLLRATLHYRRIDSTPFTLAVVIFESDDVHFLAKDYKRYIKARVLISLMKFYERLHTLIVDTSFLFRCLSMPPSHKWP
ncbi:hypothetical protein ScPMuIL_007631 [Solemya velum]